MFINTCSELSSYAKIIENSLEKQKIKILVCGGTGCVAGGSLDIYDELARLVEENGNLADVSLLKEDESEVISVKKSGCHGFCEAGPLVRIEPYNYLYLKVKLSDCLDIFNNTVLNGVPVERLMNIVMAPCLKSRKKYPSIKNRQDWC